MSWKLSRVVGFREFKVIGLNSSIYFYVNVFDFGVFFLKVQVMLELKIRVEELKMENEY